MRPARLLLHLKSRQRGRLALVAALLMALAGPAGAQSAPAITGVTLPAAGTYGSTAPPLTFAVRFDQPVLVNTAGGSPSLPLTVGSTLRPAAYLGGSGTATLTFAYTVAVGEADANGLTLAAALALNGSTIQGTDGTPAGLALPAPSSTGVVIDGILPVVSTIGRLTSPVTNAASVVFRVTFSERVTGVDATDFTLATTGTAAGTVAAVGTVGTGGRSYNVTVNSLAGDGELRLDLPNPGPTAGVVDAAGNPLGGSYTTGASYILDNSAATTLILSGPPNPSNTHLATFEFGAAEGGLFYVSIDGWPPTLTQTPVTYANQLPGTHTLSVYLVDQAGNADPTPATYTWTVVPGPVPDLLVTGSLQVQGGGTYRNVTIADGGGLALTGNMVVTGALVIQRGGSLVTDVGSTALPGPKPDCILITGPGSFELQDGGALGICDPQGLSLTGASGSVQVTGTRTYGAGGQYTYNGVAAAVTGPGLPARVRKLEASNRSGLTLSQPVAVTSQLTLWTSNLYLNGHQLTLTSTADATAWVYNSGGVVVGNTAVMQRFINPARNPGLGYRHYSSPVSGSTLADLATPTGFTPEISQAAAYNSSATPGLVVPFPTVYRYNESRVTTSPATAWAPFERGWEAPTDLGTPLLAGQGYTVNLDGSQLVDFRGTLHNGPYTRVLSRGTGPDAGWHLVGNPYPSVIELGLMTEGNSPADNLQGVGAAVYTFESSGPYAGQYRASVAGVGSQWRIASSQGFFVRALRPNAVLQFTNSIRGFDSVPFRGNEFYRGAPDTRPRLQLSLTDAAGHADPTIVYFATPATAGFDASFDAGKLHNPGGSLDLATVSGPEEYAINALPLLGAQAVRLPLAVRVPQPGSYAFLADELLHFGPGTTAWLHDAATGTHTQLLPGRRCAFTLAARTAPGRFTVEFRPAGVLAAAVENTGPQVSLCPNPASRTAWVTLAGPLGRAAITATLVSAVGRVVHTQQLAPSPGLAQELRLADVAPGVYLLRLSTAAGLLTRKLVVE